MNIRWQRQFWNMPENSSWPSKTFMSLKHFRAMAWQPSERVSNWLAAIMHLSEPRRKCQRICWNSQRHWRNRGRHRCFSQRMADWPVLLPLQIPWRKTADRLSVNFGIWASGLWCWPATMREQPEPSVHRPVWMMWLPVCFRMVKRVWSESCSNMER